MRTTVSFNTKNGPVVFTKKSKIAKVVWKFYNPIPTNFIKLWHDYKIAIKTEGNWRVAELELT